MKCLLVRYHEIALKGKNRPMFVRVLSQNLSKATRGLGVSSPRSLTGRIMMELPDGCPEEEIALRVGRVFGTANFSLASRTRRDVEALQQAIGTEIGRFTFASFKVDSRRADKSFSLTSQEINTKVGAHLQALTHARVDLESPDLTVGIEILPTEAYYYFGKRRGPGGLPVGVSGRVLGLISGGIDSPVAAFRMMKRGCVVSFVHFHSHPFQDKTSQDKVLRLMEILTRFQYSTTLFFVPFGEIQRDVVLSVPQELRVIVYRRLMMRIAGEIARAEGAKALVTGESLGQVASQTLESLTCIERASPVPVLRPLVGMDKDEITAQARAIGTYETSIIPDQDCCQLFVPEHPATHASVEAVSRAEERLEIAGLVRSGVERAERRHFAYP